MTHRPVRWIHEPTGLCVQLHAAVFRASWRTRRQPQGPAQITGVGTGVGPREHSWHAGHVRPVEECGFRPTVRPRSSPGRSRTYANVIATRWRRSTRSPSLSRANRRLDT
jgi:hypothetical protein